MSNMRYCRFRNTRMDLRDCVDAMQEAYDIADLDMDSEEESAMKYMRKLCERFLEELDRLESSESIDFDDEE